ncbi:MAG: SURF1 family protein [Anaerolineales bacterium]|nr:SURF1 family protein [Anaerolineales bacterium]
MSWKTFFRRPWVFISVLVLLAAAGMARLGVWQLDRLEQRRAFNAQVLSQIDAPLLPLTEDVIAGDLEALEFRSVQITGQYDLERTLVLGNQIYAGDQVGVHLVSPLKIAGVEAFILVDRGWIPFTDWQNREIGAYDQPGEVTITAMLRNTQTRLGLRECIDEPISEFPFQVWCLALEGIAEQLPYDLLSVYAIELPQGEQTSLPYRSQPRIEISEGNHLSYAVQWFSFASILLLGYPFFVRREVQFRQQRAGEERESAQVEGKEYHGWEEHLSPEQRAAYELDDQPSLGRQE